VAYQNGFGPAFLHRLLQRLVKGKAVKTCQFSLPKWFWPSIFAQFAAEAGERQSKAQHLPKKSVINMI
jgi:hypothetical protein